MYGKLCYWQWCITLSLTENLTSTLSVRPRRMLMSRFTGVCHASWRHGIKYDVLKSSASLLILTAQMNVRQCWRELRSVSNWLLPEIHSWLSSIRIFLPHTATNVNYLAHPQNNNFSSQPNLVYRYRKDFLLLLHTRILAHISEKRIFVKLHGFYD